MRIADLKKDDVAVILATERIIWIKNQDPHNGCTEVIYQDDKNHAVKAISWADNPEVIYKGKGRIQISYIWPD